MRRRVSADDIRLNMKRGTMVRKLTIEYEEDILLGLGLSPDQFSEEAKFLLAAKLYELGRLTSGQAARLCGKERVAFLLSLERAGMPMSNLRPEDAEAELSFGRDG
jgi:predicted HTH domain antitoxin